MVVLTWNSLIPAMILVCSLAAVQKTVQCQFVSEFALVKTVNVLLCSLGNTRPGKKVSELSSEGDVRRHCAAQGRSVNLCEADRRNVQEMPVCCVANHNSPLHLAQLVQPMLADHHVPQVLRPQNSPHTTLREFLLFLALSTL